MYRARIERLEERKLFSVTDLIIDPVGLVELPSATIDEPPAIVDFIDQDEISTPLDRVTASYNGDVTLSVVGDFNGDGRDDLATFTHWMGRDRLQGVVAGNFIGVNRLLPYLEQDNVYKMGHTGDATESAVVGIVAGDCISLTTGPASLVSITDGSSNTLMFGESAQSIPPVDIDLLGALVDTSPIELSVLALDTWEHASLTDYGPTNSIIALLVPAAIGTPTGSVTFGLAADPSDASIVYLSSKAALPLTTESLGSAPTRSYVQGHDLADGSVSFIRVDTSGMTDPAASLVSPLRQSNPGKSLLGSDEFFSRFANTTLDDEALVATTYGRGLEPRKLTHNAEFETWASVSSFDRGYLPPALEDVLVSGILHEENEFSFPRMFAGGVRVG